MKLPAKIALFGGTFDPIHNGHLALAEQARHLARTDQVFFIPCRQSPHKGEAPLATAEQRCTMIDLALAPLEWATLSRVEIDRDSPSFSWQTAAHFSTQFPTAELYWILGSDHWSKIGTWAETEKLRQQLTFIVAMRNSDSIEPRPGWKHLPLPFDHPASASAIRSGNHDPAWLPPPVADFIDTHHVYC